MGRALEFRQSFDQPPAMKLLLLALGFIVGSTGFPMCTNGLTPLMEVNDAFTCDRGCPLGFNCEFQDADFTMSKAICCPNTTALQQLYGDEEHSEPIWDLSEVANLSAGLQSALENAVPSTSNETIISASESQSAVTDTVPSDTTTASVEETTISSGTSASQQVESTEETASTIVYSTPDSSSSELVQETESTTIADTSPVPVMTIAEFTAEVSTKTTESPNEQNASTISMPQQSSTINEAASSTVEPSEEPPKEATTLSSVNIVVELEGSGSDEKVDPVIAQMKSCARQKFSLTCHNGTQKTQATIRWSRNPENGACEFYPFGYCPGNRIIESVTIRTKEECEEHCAVATMEMPETGLDSATLTGSSKYDSSETAEKSSTDATVEVLSSTESSTKETPHQVFPTMPSLVIAVKDSNIEMKHENIAVDPTDPTLILEASNTAEKNTTNYEPLESTATPKIAIEDPSVEQKHENLEISATSPNNQESASAAEKQVQPPLTEAQEKVLSGAQHPDEVEQGTGIPETATSEKTMASGGEETPSTPKDGSEEVRQEVLEGLSARNQVSEKTKVACASTSYRYACENGHPSQFVYRWEMVDGVCQSFAYGYCYGEFNHPHPRTMDECQVFCAPSVTRRRFAF